MGQYAIEVEKKHAESFDDLTGDTILERAEIEENGTVGFIVSSRKDLRSSAVFDMPGVCSIEPLWGE